MVQTTAGLFVIGWKLALTVIAGSTALTTVGVFLLARFTSVFDAYAGERARLSAQFHNLDRLVEQTEKADGDNRGDQSSDIGRSLGSPDALEPQKGRVHPVDGDVGPAHDKSRVQHALGVGAPP